jgi:hypothetical protein
MHRQRGSRPGPLALILVAAIAAISITAIALHRPAVSKPEAARVAVTAPVSPASAGITPTAESPKPAAAPTQAIAKATPAKPATPSATDPSLPARSAGMVVGIDPETKTLVFPSAADRAALQRQPLSSPALDRSDAGLTVIHRPDGSKMVDLQGRFQEYAVVRITPDGKKVESCVQGPQVEAALQPPAASTPASAER